MTEATVPAKRPHILRWIIVSVVVLIAGGGIYWWWDYSQKHPSTDDAYVKAHVVYVAAQVIGPVAEVAVVNNQRVKAGEVLFTIDPAPFNAARDKATANLLLAKQASAADAATVVAAESVVRQRRAEFENAQKNARRFAELAVKGDVPKARSDDEQATMRAARAALGSAQAELVKAQQELGKTGNKNAAIRAAMAALAEAELDIKHTTITAPTDGWVTSLTLRPGSMVTVGKTLFSIVESGEWWIEANFKETDLGRIMPGQPATVGIDIYPDLSLTGIVESISAGSGAAFSLLPPENATGNWVKVTQRFPVRIKLDPPKDGRELRIGASASVTVNVTADAPPGTTAGSPPQPSKASAAKTNQ